MPRGNSGSLQGILQNFGATGELEPLTPASGVIPPVSVWDFLLLAGERLSINVQTLTGNLTLTESDALYQYLDCGASNRDVTLPAAPGSGRHYIIQNAGAANTLTIKDSGGATVTTVGVGETTDLVWTGSTWVETTGGGLSPAGQILAISGTAAAPSYAYASDPSTGHYLYAFGTLGLSTGGTARQIWGTAGTQFASTYVMEWSSGAVGAASDLGFARVSAGVAKVTDGGAGYGSLRIGAGSMAAGAIAFGSDAGTGLYDYTGTGAAYAMTAGGQICLYIHPSGPIIGTGMYLSWSAGGDVRLYRDAADVLSQQRATNAQTFRVYGTTTGPAYVSVSHSGTYGLITTTVGSPLQLGADGSGWWIIDNGSALFHPATSGTMSFGSTSYRVLSTFLGGATLTANAPALDIAQTWNNGAVAFTGIKSNITDTASDGGSMLMDLQVGGVSQFYVRKDGVVIATNSIAAGAAGALTWYGRSIMNSPSDGVITLLDNAQATFSRLQFGGTTASFPALKRSSATLEVRLADDSAYGSMTLLDLYTGTGGGVNVRSGASAGVSMYATADGVLRLTDWAGTSFTGLNLGGASAELRVNGTKVVSAQGAAVADAAGGATVDAEARTAINDLLARVRAHGLIAT